MRRFDAPAPVVRVPRFNAVVVDDDGAAVAPASSGSVNTSPPPLKFSSDDNTCSCCLLLFRLLDLVFTARDDILVVSWWKAVASDRIVRLPFFAVIIDTEQQITKARLKDLNHRPSAAAPWH